MASVVSWGMAQPTVVNTLIPIIIHDGGGGGGVGCSGGVNR